MTTNKTVEKVCKVCSPSVNFECSLAKAVCPYRDINTLK
jgi:hypothetical protein